jgi:tetratricopeptide (TPR) repeat protein
VRYTQDKFPKDLVFQEVSKDELLAKVRNAGKYFFNRASVVFQGRYVIRRPQGSASGVAKWRYGRWKNQWAKNLVKLTDWNIKAIREKMAFQDDIVALANALTQQGQKLENSQKYEEALVYYNKAVNFDSGNVTAWFNRGLSLYELGHLEEALTSLDKAVALDANNWRARYKRDELRRELGH